MLDCPEPPLDPPEPREEAGEWYYGCFIPEAREWEPEDDPPPAASSRQVHDADGSSHVEVAA